MTSPSAMGAAMSAKGFMDYAATSPTPAPGFQGTLSSEAEPSTGWGSVRANSALMPQFTQEHLSGGNPIRFFQSPQQRGDKFYEGLKDADVAMWPGPRNVIPHQWQPLDGALAGANSRGFWQARENTKLSPPNPLTQAWYMLARSTRTTSQRYNSSAAGYYVPSVFIPTAPVNSRGSYSA